MSRKASSVTAADSAGRFAGGLTPRAAVLSWGARPFPADVGCFSSSSWFVGVFGYEGSSVSMTGIEVHCLTSKPVGKTNLVDSKGL